MPRRPAIGMSLETREEVVLEQRQIQEILSEVRGSREEIGGLRGHIRDLRTVLMGAGDGETPHGRIPQVEQKLSAMEERVKVLEQASIRYGVYGHFLSLTGGLLAGCAGAALQWITHQMLMR